MFLRTFYFDIIYFDKCYIILSYKFYVTYVTLLKVLFMRIVTFLRIKAFIKNRTTSDAALR